MRYQLVQVLHPGKNRRNASKEDLTLAGLRVVLIQGKGTSWSCPWSIPESGKFLEKIQHSKKSGG